jgi:hypothetical protein
MLYYYWNTGIINVAQEWTQGDFWYKLIEIRRWLLFDGLTQGAALPEYI